MRRLREEEMILCREMRHHWTVLRMRSVVLGTISSDSKHIVYLFINFLMNRLKITDAKVLLDLLVIFGLLANTAFSLLKKKKFNYRILIPCVYEVRFFLFVRFFTYI